MIAAVIGGSGDVDSLFLGVADGLHRVSGDGVSLFEGVVMAIFALYLFWLGRLMINKRRHSTENTYSAVQRKSNDTPIYSGEYLLRYLLVTAMYTLLVSQLVGDVSWATLGAVALGWHAVFLVSTCGLWLSCYLSYQEPLFWEIFRVKAENLVKNIIWSLPITLVLALSKDTNIILYIAAFQAIAILCGYIYATFVLFRAKKIPILSWISYLCTVELIPIILFGVILSRNIL